MMKKLICAMLAAFSLITFQVGAVHAFELTLGLQAQDRRNQVGLEAQLWKISAVLPVEDWTLESHLALDQRLDDVPGVKWVAPIAVRREWSNGGLVAGYAPLPNWGYGRTAPLVLSNLTPPMLQVGFRWRSGKFTYEKLVGFPDFSQNKYLFAHRLEVSPTPTLDLSVSEVVMASEKAARVYTNFIPGWPLYLNQHFGIGNFHNDDFNGHLALGARWQSPWATLYGDLFVDDMPMSPEHGDAYLIAAQGGIERPIILWGREAVLGVEYTRVNNWTYTIRRTGLDYTHHGYVIGHWLGPDSDLVDVSVRLPQTRMGDVTVSYQRVRHGEGRIGDVWEDYGTEYARQHDFLTGVVEVQHLLGIAHERPVGESGQLKLSLQAGPVRNIDNRSGKDGFVARVSAAVQLLW